MNHIYHSIWNEALGAWIAVSEIAAGQGKRSANRRKKPMTASPSKDWQSSTPLLATGLLLCSSASWALPTGNELVAGQATVTTPNTGQMQINQASQNAIINWQGFSIDPNQAVNIQQPNAQAALLNRVVGQDASQIQGQLNANGQVYLVNPNGVLFSKTAQVDVGGLIASTHNISNADFMNGNHHFTQNGATGSIDNQGNIKTPEGGIVALIGKQVSNSGNIQTPKGTTALAAGKTVDLDFQGNGLVEVKVTEAALKAQIDNKGAIQADGGHVILSANAAGQLIDTVINSQGVIQARGLIEKNGVIKLDGGDNGTVKVTGTLDAGSPNLGLNASGNNTNQGLNSSGGNITVKGADIQLANGANINASGNTGGGTINIGDKQITRTSTIDKGATVSAQTLDNGTAGTINVFANMNNGVVKVDGQLDASAPNGGDGGFIDTSAAHVNVADTAQISTKAANGKTGKWLIDPTDYTIAASGGNLTGAALATYLGSSNIEIQTLATGTTGQGDIFVNNAVTWNNFNELILTAHRNVNVNAPINANGGGSVRLRADSLGTGTGTVAFTGTGHITVNNGAAVGIYYNPVSYTDAATQSNIVVNPYSSKLTLNTGSYATAFMLVNDVNQLQAMNTNLIGNYALGKNIDASATVGWNTGAGFEPIGNSFSTTFRGNFDGLNHTIMDVTINRPSTNNVGLFGFTGGNISNLGLVGGNITGNRWVGGLAGEINGTTATINNVYTTGNVSGNIEVGGLAGYSWGATINNTHTTGNVNGNNSVGGLVGNSNQRSDINNSYATGNVTGADYVGGLVGSNWNTINNSYATGNIIGTNNTIGGLVGINNLGVISNTHATGSVSGNGSVGGLVGYNSGVISKAYATGNVRANIDTAGGLVSENASASNGSTGIITYGSISDAYATGNVTVTNNSAGGGLVAYNIGTIENSYATGRINSASPSAGGLVGIISFGGNTISSFWDITTSGKTASSDGTGLTTAQMKQQASFTGWDFANTWQINQGVSYPTLQAANTTPVTQQGTRGAAVFTPLTTPLSVTAPAQTTSPILVSGTPNSTPITTPIDVTTSSNSTPITPVTPTPVTPPVKPVPVGILASLDNTTINNIRAALYQQSNPNFDSYTKAIVEVNKPKIEIQYLSGGTSTIPEVWHRLTQEQRASITKGSAFFAQTTGNKPETLENAAYDMRSSIDMIDSKAASAIGDIPDYEIADGIQLKDYLLSSASLRMKAKIWDDNLSLSNSLAQFDDNYINGRIDTSKFTQASDVVDKINGTIGKKGQKSFGESMYDSFVPLVNVLKTAPTLVKIEANFFLAPEVKMYEAAQTIKSYGGSTIAAVIIATKGEEIMEATGNLFTLGGAMYSCLNGNCGNEEKNNINQSIVELGKFANSLKKLDKEADNILTKMGVMADVLSLLTSIEATNKASSALKAVDKISENIIGSGDKSLIKSKISREVSEKNFDAIMATGNILKHFTPQVEKMISFASDAKEVYQPFNDNANRVEAKSIEANKLKYDANTNLLSGAIITKSVALRDYTQKLGEIAPK